MAHAYYHSKSSARTFGGDWQDYMELHEFMDHTKAHIPDSRHRLLLHNSWGIFLVERIFGKVWICKSNGKEIPTRAILEKHVQEDLRCIPTLEQCFSNVPIEDWQFKKAKQLSRELNNDNTV